jgi:hypothetical protein
MLINEYFPNLYQSTVAHYQFPAAIHVFAAANSHGAVFDLVEGQG